jgi:UDP-2,3-diacylglucosamine hydrolase
VDNHLKEKKKIYFASDLHLGLPDSKTSLIREKLFVSWLDEIKNDAEEIYLLGDIFDFWWEWKRAVPRGFTRFLGKLCELTDNGIPVHFFTGNHDIWIYDYLPNETGIILHRKAYTKKICGKKFFMAHGDGLGPADHSYKFLKKIFTNKLLQWCYSRLHPNFSLWFGHSWSRSRRLNDRKYEFKGEKEWLIIYSREILKKEHFDYFIFGHRHIPTKVKLNEKSTFLNLGDWFKNFTYAVFDGKDLTLKWYKK